MQFEWDENKNKLNIEKHEIDFNNVKELFNDRKRKTSPDLRKEYGEDRWITIGKILDSIIVVVYAIRNNYFRIISARFVNKRERNNYFNIA